MSLLLAAASLYSAGGVGNAVSTDDFDRADEALGASADWTVSAANADVDIVTNKIRTTYGTGGSYAALHGDTRANDQYAQLRYSDFNGGALDTRLGVFCRGTDGATTLDGYSAYWQHSTDEAPDWKLRLFIWTDPNFGVYLGNYNFGDTEPAATDILKLRCIGTTISVENDVGAGFVERISITNAVHSAGKAGIYGRVETAGQWMEGDDWEAGDE